MKMSKGIKTQKRKVQRGTSSRVVLEGGNSRTWRSGQPWTLFKEHDLHAVSRPLKALKREAGLVRCAFRKATLTVMGRRDWSKTKAGGAVRRCCCSKRKLTRAGGYTRAYTHTSKKQHWWYKRRIWSLDQCWEGSQGRVTEGTWWWVMGAWMVRGAGSSGDHLWRASWLRGASETPSSFLSVHIRLCQRGQAEALTGSHLLRGGT